VPPLPKLFAFASCHAELALGQMSGQIQIWKDSFDRDLRRVMGVQVAIA
jgi:hypothetical protein